MSKNVLILGGTAEAFDLADKLNKEHPDWKIISSLAGRTESPKMPIGETRVGGFGGVDGLIKFIEDNQINKVIDATHPFAKIISNNAVIAAKHCGIAHQVINRLEWEKQPDDNWITVNSIEEAAQSLPKNAIAFLALGRQYIDAFNSRSDCQFIVRMVDKPSQIGLVSYQLILGKPAQDADKELALFNQHEITHLVTRNSGGERSYAKITAARLANLPVIMIARPQD